MSSDQSKTTRTPAFCRHGRPSQAENIDDPADTKIMWLCAWASTLDGRSLLMGAPPWVGREAMAGHMMKPGDCAWCSKWDARDV
jgi:hypothetical protein